jgi:catechol 2,3-dioxygenase-like lactoylglutathione lyase family enzyme
VEFWQDRLAARGVAMEPSFERFDETVVPFTDHDGMRMELIEAAGASPAQNWSGSVIAPEFAIAGFHSATLAETEYESTADLLASTMGFRAVGREQNRFRYEVAEGGVTKTVDLISAPGPVAGRIAVGSVHHIAWRTRDDASQLEWLTELSRLGHHTSDVMDRVYFHSIYYREPGGILFEIATDSPGFAVDEPFESLGTALMLPPWLEPARDRIEAALPPIHPLQERVAS